MVMNIDNWMVVFIVVVRISSWVSINSLIIVVNCLLVDWFDLMG